MPGKDSELLFPPPPGLDVSDEFALSCIQLLRDQLIRLEKRQALIFIFTDAVEMVFEDFELLKSLEEKGKVGIPEE